MSKILYETLTAGVTLTYNEKKRTFDIELADGQKLEGIIINEAYQIADSIVHVMTGGNSKWQKEMKKEFWELG